MADVGVPWHRCRTARRAGLDGGRHQV